MLIEIFCQKPIDSEIILAYLDHLNPKLFFVGHLTNCGDRHRAPLLFKVFISAPV